VLFVQEEPIADAPPFRWRHFLRTLFDPLRSHDFRWVFLTRLLVMMGIYTVQEFLQFYFKDVIGAPFVIAGVTVAETPEAAVSFFIMPLLLGALASSLTAGKLSDRYGRKPLVYASGGLMGLVALVFILTTDFALAAAMGLIFGLGFGAYTAVDWALATDVLPSIDDFAKDMGVWHIAIVLPQVVATPIAGFLLDHFQVVGRGMGQPNLGYTVIFLVAVGYFVLGTVFVRRIRGAR
jgi:MFS family permease